ncbi:MAG: hypothetical protein LBM77_01725 [Spirochaetaceae bacterium]|nr:hypothetical protein [Spirochaetaceae bacterium]
MGELSIGLCVEGNQYTISDTLAFGGGALVDFRFTNALTAGLKVNIFDDFNGVLALEIEPLFRWYIASVGFADFFAQADAGITIITVNSQAYNKVSFAGGLTAGARINIWKGLYVDPFVSFQYPKMMSFGMYVGYSFDLIKE